MKWKPIETVPKKPKHIVLLSDGCNVAMVHWHDEMWCAFGFEILPDIGRQFTHWMPLPKPPKATGGE